MTTALAIAGWSAFAVAVVIGLALNLVGLFGNWIILGAVGVLWAVTGFEHFGVWALSALVLLAILGEALETVAAGYGASRFGGGKGSIFAAVIGCLLGAVFGTPLIPIPVVGTLIGACLGAFAGAALYEYLAMEKPAHHAAWTGVGAALGKVAGVFAKVFIGFAMLLVAAITYS